METKPGQEIQDSGMNWRQVEAAGQDRRGWRRLVYGLCSTGTEALKSSNALEQLNRYML